MILRPYIVPTVSLLVSILWWPYGRTCLSFEGFPTANFAEDVIEALPQELVGGIYWGFASVDNGPVYGMVMSIG